MIKFWIAGIPKPSGSKRGFVNKKTGRVIITDAAGQPSKDWRYDCKKAAEAAMDGAPPLAGALTLDVIFVMPRPKSHYRTGKNAGLIKPDAPFFCTTTPDATKLTRGLEDSLTGIVWKDDAQVCVQYVRKLYDANPGAWVVVREAGLHWEEME